MKAVVLLLTMTVATRVTAQERFASSLDATLPPPPPRTLRLEIAPHIFDELDRLADTLRHETVRCLIGRAAGNRAVIDLAWEPPVSYANATRVRYQTCPVATIALWHNHPQLRGLDPEYACYLSATDVREGIRPNAPPVQIVQVTSRVACWWGRHQILEAGEVPILWPLESQRRGKHVTLSDACSRRGGSPPCTLASHPLVSGTN